MSKCIAYIRLYANVQDVEQQRHEILNYANQQQVIVDELMEVTISSNNKTSRQKRIDELKNRLQPNDLLISTELRHLGRSTGEVITLLDQLLVFGVKVIIIQQNLQLIPDTQDVTTSSMLSMLSMFAEMERRFTSTRTKEALAERKAAGAILGKPKGTIQTSIYDKDREKIEMLLDLGVSQRRIIEKHLGYGTSNSLSHYIRTRGLMKKTAQVTL